MELGARLTLNEAAARPLLAAGADGAVLEFADARFAPFRYVIPAHAPDASHAAWYSGVVAPEGPVRVERACITFGRRDGAPFIHCHAVWTEADGTRRAGHVLPHEAVLVETVPAVAWGTAAVAIRAELDPETNFPLFGPVATGRAGGRGPTLVLARIAPGEDVVEAVEALCRQHGIAAGRLRGSLGSVAGAIFEDGREVEELPTEFLVLDGAVTPGPDAAPRAVVDVALVDVRGRLHRGRLARGRNPVLITFELAVEAT